MLEKYKLENGATVLLDHVDGVRSASIGLWFRAGSRDETPQEAGAAHFIEHMLFKGTASLSSAELAGRMDDIGAEANAFTSRDCTNYYMRVLDKRMPEAAELLADMLFNSRFDEGDMSTERGVILDEMRMYEDMPDDVANEMLVRTCFPGALGAPVLGSRESVEALTRSGLLGFKSRHYAGPGTVLAVSGRFDDGDASALADRLAALPAEPAAAPERAEYTPGIALEGRDTEQNQLLLAFPGITYGSGERPAMAIMNTILGGSASSRLYTRLRDELGLCYDLESFDMTYADTGLVGIGAATSAGNEQRALREITDGLRRFLDEGPSDSELARAKAQAESGAVIALESTLARMRRMGQSELFLGRVDSIDEVVERYNAVTREDVLDFARRTFDFSRLSVAALGKVRAREEYEALRLL
ncbi:MAG TPA: insulinase family protein [Candidatus Scatomorpha gallistercoris]|nr:insulinase family protein [Candidatus Scatomorpha gallistercoris]